MSSKLKVVFCGTPDFSVPSLEMLVNYPCIDIVKVITMPDRPAGRGQKLTPPPVAVFANQSKLELIQTENLNKESDLLNELDNLKIDLVIVLAFAQFLGKRWLSLPRLGCFNIHTSLLPKYRGAAPIQYALLNGDKTTGVTIQKMVKEMDAGDIVHSQEVSISDKETGGQLYTRLKFAAALSLNDFINNLLENKITATSQDISLVSFAPTLDKENGFLDFYNKSSEAIYNQVRALRPWPGTYCFINNNRIKVFEVEMLNDNISPGKIKIINNQLLVGCQTGCVRLKQLQCEGKKCCQDGDFINGAKNMMNLEAGLILTHPKDN